MRKIKLLSLSEVRAIRASRKHLRSYQTLTPPKDKPFPLSALFALRGVQKPSDRQYTYMRHWLRDNNFIKQRIKNREEFWAHESISNTDPEKKCLYTMDSFVAKFFPGICLPLKPDSWPRWQRTMRDWGLQPRMNELYWSYVEPRRVPLPKQRPKAEPPSYVKIPRGAFCLLDLLELNKMRRFPQNYSWAKQYLHHQGISRLHGTNRYAQKDKRGRLPAAVTGLWLLPGPAFTTFEFQKYNHALKPTAEEWQLALDFLLVSGYIFDPKWKRWKRDGN